MLKIYSTYFSYHLITHVSAVNVFKNYFFFLVVYEGNVHWEAEEEQEEDLRWYDSRMKQSQVPSSRMTYDSHLAHRGHPPPSSTKPSPNVRV